MASPEVVDEALGSPKELSFSQALRRFEVQLSTLLGFANLALTAYLITQVRRRSKTIMADLTGLQQSVANETTV